MHVGFGHPLFLPLKPSASGQAGPVAFRQGGDSVRFEGLAVGKSRKTRLAIETAERIEDILAQGRPLDARDRKWVEALDRMLGRRAPVFLTHPEQPGKRVRLESCLTVDAINRNREANLRQLRDTLRAMVAATRYQPIQKTMQSPTGQAYTLTIHNPELAGRLKPAYTSEAFGSLLALCRQNGVFDLAINKATGLVETAGIDESEDVIMSQGWVTDTIRNGVLQQDLDPRAWKRALRTLAVFYRNEQPAFYQIFRNPARYNDPDTGVHHMFDPATRKRYPWLSSKRLESHALALKAFCDTALADDGACALATMKAIANLSHYFAVIGYPTAPTIGAWEELPFDGLTSDVELIRAALESLRALLYDPAYADRPGIAQLRDRFRHKTYAKLLPTPEELDALIAQGQQKVEERVKGDRPAEHPDRPADAGLAFVTTSTIRLGASVAEDVAAHLGILRFLNHTVVRDNGVIRYQPFETTVSDGHSRRRIRTFDGYLTPNWGLAADGQGRLSLHKQAFERKFKLPIAQLSPSTPEGFTARASYAGQPGTEAEWFMIAEMAKGYALQLGKLLDVLERENRPPDGTERQLMQEALQGATEAINRSLARITAGMPDPIHQLKSNGRSCPRWAVPEAYQHVSTLDGKTRMMPGVNTPLAWAASSLYGAAQTYLATLRRLEALPPEWRPIGPEPSFS